MSRVLGVAAVLLTLVLPPAASAAPLPGLPSNEEIFQSIVDVTSHGPRRVGSPGLEHAVSYIEDRFRSYGLTGVHVEETPTWSWETQHHALHIGDTPVDAFPIAYSMSPSATAEGDFSTPAGGLKAPVVDAGIGTAAGLLGKDVKGKIVMFDLKFLLPLAGLVPFMEFLWDPAQTITTDVKGLITANPYITTIKESIGAAMDAGAVGVIGVLSDYFNSNRYYNELYRALNFTIPGMWVTAAEGAKIRAQLAADPSTPATMELQIQRRKVASHVVVGYLEGKSKDTIMVTSHHDSVFTGAVEDGSGVSEVLALAKYFTRQPPGTREKTLMFATFDSHFSGYQAHQAFVKRHITQRVDEHRPVADVTLEHIARYARFDAQGKLEVTDLPEPRGIFENVNVGLKSDLIGGIVRNDLRRTAVLNGTIFEPLGVPTDASFILLSGIPTVSYIAGPIYLYDAADTLDKIQKDQLQPVAQTFAELIDRIDVTPSAQIGLRGSVPGAVAAPGTPPASTDRVDVATCTPASSGAAVKALRLRRSSHGTQLSFTTRRTVKLTIVVGHRGGRRVKLTRFVGGRACRRYTVRLPGTVVRARVSGGGRSVSVVRR